MTETKRRSDMTQTTEVLAAIREHLGGRGLDPARIVPEADLLRDLDLDSLDTMELTLGLEERFGIEIPDQELEGLATVADAVGLVERKLSVGA
jgi:acyl carrier protein